MEVTCALLQEKYHVEIEIKEPTVIYMERPLKSRVYHSHRSSTESFLGFHWSICSTASIRSGVQYESSVSLGYLNQSFQNAVMEGYAMAVNKDCMVGM